MAKKKTYAADRAIVISRETHEAIQKVAKEMKISENEALDKILGVGIEAVRIGYLAKDTYLNGYRAGLMADRSPFVDPSQEHGGH